MLTLAFITSRHEPGLDWFFGSLAIQRFRNIVSHILIVDFFAQPCDAWTSADVQKRQAEFWALARSYGFDDRLVIVPPKPNVWGGPHRLPKENWWHCSAARNTAICLCKTQWLGFLDDRCVLGPDWMTAVLEAMQQQYVVFGTYEKVHDLTANRGVVTGYKDIGCRDHRLDHVKLNPKFHGERSPWIAAREWAFTCSIAVPLDWALHVNGFDESADSLSGEDTAFGIMLANNSLPLRFDERMKVIQDRTPGHVGPLMKRTDKGISPADKSHAFVDNIRRARKATHWCNLRGIREAVLAGQPFPVPTGPTMDWWDKQPVKDFA